MLRKRNVMIFPAGSEIGLEIFNSLKYSHHIKLFGASGKNDHASFVYDANQYVEDPLLYIDNKGFIKQLTYHLQRLNIEFIYPTHDSVANFLAEHQSELPALVMTSCAETNRIARFKRITYETFRSFDFCLKVFHPPYRDLRFPVFLKPDDGQGGKGTFVAEDSNDLDFYLQKSPNLLVTEYLPGAEISVDCFTDFSGKLRFIGPRTRERVQMGISVRSTTIDVTEEIERIARTINDMVSLNGAWFFQLKQDSYGRYKLLEFAPRQSSTMGLYRHAGVNFALLSFFNAQKIQVDILKNAYQIQLDRCFHNRYKANFSYSRVYIDFDETIVFADKVHERVLAFLYQCHNRGIDVVLITKHAHSIHEVLRKHCISEGLFADIIHLVDSQEKWKFIDPDGAIFIDNFWFDRKSVKENLDIPVFDVDAIECLLQ